MCSENKGADQLICAFVFAYAKFWFSHDATKVEMTDYTVHLFYIWCFHGRSMGLFTEHASMSKKAVEVPKAICVILLYFKCYFSKSLKSEKSEANPNAFCVSKYRKFSSD